MNTITIRIDPSGTASLVYTELLDAAALGRALGDMSIRRASHVEPTDDGRWTADMAPVSGPKLGPFERRSEALAAETEWLARRIAS